MSVLLRKEGGAPSERGRGSVGGQRTAAPLHPLNSFLGGVPGLSQQWEAHSRTQDWAGLVRGGPKASQKSWRKRLG